MGENHVQWMNTEALWDWLVIFRGKENVPPGDQHMSACISLIYFIFIGWSLNTGRLHCFSLLQSAAVEDVTKISQEIWSSWFQTGNCTFCMKNNNNSFWCYWIAYSINLDINHTVPLLHNIIWYVFTPWNFTMKTISRQALLHCIHLAPLNTAGESGCLALHGSGTCPAGLCNRNSPVLFCLTHNSLGGRPQRQWILPESMKKKKPQQAKTKCTI